MKRNSEHLLCGKTFGTEYMHMTSFIPYVTNLKGVARELRKNMTPAEKVFWECVRNRRFLGLKFVRQRPLLMYIADFYCAEFQLVIELDGTSHENREFDDAKRSADLATERITVIRYTNNQVIFSIKETLEDLALRIEKMRMEASSRKPQ